MLFRVDYKWLLVFVFVFALVLFGACNDDDGSNKDEGDDDTSDDDDSLDDDDDDTGEDETIPPVEDDPPSEDENRYHWDGQTDPFFEGWYYKINDLETGQAYFFIYGVIFPGNVETGQGFILFGGGPDFETQFVSWPVNDFHASRDHCEVYLGSVRNSATESRITGDIDFESVRATWDFAINMEYDWEQTMGWLTNADGIDVNWHVPILRATGEGFVEINGHRMQTGNAIAYSDHNWGPTFPEYWLWMQGARFAAATSAVSISGGIVNSPWGTVDAYMIGYLHEGVLHTFRTQDNARIHGSYADYLWQLEAVQDDERLLVWATADPATILSMWVPTPTGMQPGAEETLVGNIGVTLFEKSGDAWVELHSQVTDLAGVEVGGLWQQ